MDSEILNVLGKKTYKKLSKTKRDKIFASDELTDKQTQKDYAKDIKEAKEKLKDK